MDYPVLSPEQLAAVLYGRRKQSNKTQADAAALVGLLPKTVSALENKPQRSSIETLFKYLPALDFEMILRPKEDSAASKEKLEW
jgi:HTH-type transcriptional regulator/antitoxin HipB